MAAESLNLLHSELTREIIGAGMDVHNALGPGWDEMDYHRAVLQALSSRGIKAESHLRGDLVHRNEVVDRFELDILVEDVVVLELKHIRKNFAAEHYAQLINYLKFWNKDMGMLMNFGLESLRFKRVPYSAKKGVFREEGKWGRIKEGEPELSECFIKACRNVLSEHGLGYGENTSRRLLLAECQGCGYEIAEPEARLEYDGLDIGKRAIDGFVLNGKMVVKTTALKEQTTAADLAHLMSYMKKLDIRLGALVNFGRTELILRGAIRR